MSRETKSTECSVQEKLLNFVRILPNHVESWRNILKELADPIRALLNLSEQLRLIEVLVIDAYFMLLLNIVFIYF